jgi:hypothetical protein
LSLLRQPPVDVPGNRIAFLQAECWERLGCPEVALRFMHAATPLDTAQVISVLTMPVSSEAG